MKNKYIKVAHFSEQKFRQILRLFCQSIEAKKSAELVCVNRNTINRLYFLFRTRILEIQEKEDVFDEGNIEIDESYFGARRVREKRGRGAGDKTKVFGILKRQGKIYTQVVKNCSAKELLPIILEHAKTDSKIFYDG